MGHASASYTLDLYVGYLPSTSAELSNRYMADLDKAAAECSWADVGGRCDELKAAGF